MGGLVQIMGARSGTPPASLLDVVLTSGDSFHWADQQIIAPAVYTGNVPAWASKLANPPADYHSYYFPWLLKADEFNSYRTMQVDTAEFLVQNISGNSLQRDVSTLLRAATFEGAIFAFREWYPQTQTAGFECHGRLTVINAGETDCQFGATQLFDPSNFDGNPFEFSETCQWTYALPGCADTTNNPCQNTFTTCRVPNRFFGVLNTFVQNFQAAETVISPSIVQRRRMV
jgi:hypothetical protein